ncbi:glycosyltransferase [Amycolatopsis sp. NPDC051061]|uniref:glycosyltransferase n=1 Tax=Amycolatopsis sp. NPDC051061 TaxID=3155042 RepID=UPI00343C05C3
MKDIFICHASEDKNTVVRPLIDAFNRANITYWYDEAEIKWGESITERVNHGLRESQFCLVIISAAFMGKPWPKREFFAVLNDEAASAGNTLLPIFVGTPEEQQQFRGELAMINDMSYLGWEDDPAAVVAALRVRLGHDVAANTMRVCHVSSEYPPHVFGGLGVHVEHLTRALGAHLDVEVMLPSAGNQEYWDFDSRVQPNGMARVETSYANPTSWLAFAEFASREIIRRAKESRPDVIHCHDWVTVLAGIKCRWELGIPLVMHLHLPNYSTLCASVENLGLVCADRVTVNSKAMLEELEGRRLPLRHPPVIIKNGVDQVVFRPCDDWPDGDGYLLFVGRLVEQKGVEYLLRAYQYVRVKFPNVGLKIVGNGGLSDFLRRLATNLELSNVEFIGWKSGRELAELYQRASIVVVPSIYEPFGMTALEGLACGRPVVASREGGLREIIRHGKYGFLAEPMDELGLAQWIITLLADPDLRKRMGEASREYVQKDYLWSDVAGKFLQLYDELKEKPVDLTVPDKAQEFIDQTWNLAQEMGFRPLLLSNMFDQGGSS